MAVAPRKNWTVEEYLAFERSSETRHEFLNGEVFPLGQPPSSGGNPERHDRIFINTVKALRTIATHCRVHPQSIEAFPAKMEMVPDIVVACHESPAPDLLIEILSPSTERYDRGLKFQHYRAIETLQAYVLIAQDAPRIERFARTDDDRWLLTDVVGLDAALELPSIGCRLRLADVYAQVSFSDEAGQ